MIRAPRPILVVLYSILLSSPTILFASDELYDAPGLDPHRETLSSIPNEHIDPFTGGVILSFEDFRLPGNGGLDLVIQRTFNSKSTCNQWTNLNGWYCSKNDDNTWLGFGWTLHFGRLYKSNNANVPHIVELPDGSRHAAYHNISGSGYITKDYWLVNVDANPPVVTLTNGTQIYYGQGGPPHPDYSNSFAYLATQIRDANGNTIDIHYAATGSNIISYVTDSLRRAINFYTSTINNATKLTSITGPGCAGKNDHSQNCLRIDYTHQSLPTSGWTMLTMAQPPVGNPWQYTYDQTLFDLTGLTTPSGGTINYTYDFVNVNMGFSFTYRAVTQKATGGTVPVGRWRFAYSQGTYNDYTQISDPCGRTIKYTYYGYGSQLGNGSMWKLGLPKSKEIVGEETTNYHWTNSQYISGDDYDVPYIGNDQFIYVPYLTQKSIMRDTKTYSTNYSGYDNYGNPGSVTETGDKTRNRNISYWYNTSKNIVQNKPSSETLSGGFSGSFTTNYSYDTNTGNLLQLNKYGMITNYAYYPNGNLQTVRDANQHTTTYGWTNGRISGIAYPLYSVTRVINDNGTIASETNGRGKTTNFTYDGNLRLLTTDPPAGNTTFFTYASDNSYKKETRGQYYTYYHYDGFGRPTGTNDIKGIITNIIYNACGLKDYATSNVGDTVYYDHFGRIEQIVHQDNNDINYYYSNSDVNVIDEANNSTFLTYNAFGNPDEKLLVSVRDAMSNTTTYNCNILGSLTSVTQGNMTRSFNYDSRNLLTSESHPEKGTTTYGRDNVGNLTSKTDGKGVKTYTYDALDRLTGIGPVNITFSYDNANNRTSMVNSSANISYAYDESNRLTEKQETVLGVIYTTQFDYDGNDNVTGIDYPLGRHVTYSYNAYNQVTSVTGFGGSINNIIYYTSGSSVGLPHSFTNQPAGLTTNFSYNNRNLVTDISTGSALHIGYGYDTRGNTISMSNYIDGSKNQTFGYDNLNRLTSFNGSWCAGYCTGSFTYDSIGNRTSKRVGSSNTSYTYNSSTNRLTSTSGGESIAFSYDSDGDASSLTIAGVPYDLQYDTLHNLTGYNYNHGGDAIARFGYDGDGMRVTKTSAGRTIVYHYDKEGRVLSETDQNGSLITDYVYLNGKLVAKIVSEVVTPPSAPSGPSTGNTGVNYPYGTGGSTSNVGHSVQYLFDWGDGTNSGWLTLGTASASKAWSMAGSYTVKAQARCAINTSVVSAWSSVVSVTIAAPPRNSIFSDFNGDRRTDALWRHGSTGTVAIWLMNGTSISSTGVAGGVTTDWQIKGVGDFNGDGKADILWQHIPTGTVGTWLMNGTSISSTGVAGGVTTDWQIKGVGDFNGDGKADILYYHAATGTVAIWLMDGTTISSVGVAGGVGNDWQIKGVGDFNGDGKADIMYYHAATGTVAIWLMDGTTISSVGVPGGISDLDWQIAQQTP
jgi:YD repeat-containing protein